MGKYSSSLLCLTNLVLDIVMLDRVSRIQQMKRFPVWDKIDTVCFVNELIYH